jgi:hypothetical protein
MDPGARRHSFGEERTEIVDWYDASEHIWTVAKALYGDDTPETTKEGPKRPWIRSGRPGAESGAGIV